ncbi:hypothetical protein NGB36_03730 [Streptomyces sp. RB6PN25]|uniref:Helix-turn-helix DNA binding domain protein n=1 Tax=Streptomyces humicola TaxID=2953240 RepID=A0ABT1PPW9_9ACTN|nr:hypothetical protein [Streptomyces humicola]MCQ4079726.1 hypothetical protein [Streptomyces humicola]
MSSTEEPEGEEQRPELCDLCGAVICNDAQVYALVPDSSAIHSVDARLDGVRMVTACSPDHLAELQENYRLRPFVDEELWVGKIARALNEHAAGLTLERLAEMTRLSLVQIDRAVVWQNQRFRQWQERLH